jgi:choline kinase
VTAIKANRKALILAAGRGLRMGGGANQLPKCLLTVGSETILAFQLRTLRAVGIEQVAVVTGYRSEAVCEGAADYDVAFFHNADYDSTNSLYSFYCARDFAEEGTLVINSDVVFHPTLLRRLMDEPNANALLYDPRPQMGDEEMKVVVDASGNVERISKRIDPGSAAGENLGLVKFGPGTASAAFEALQAEGLRGLWLPECINALRGVRPFRAVEAGDLPWTEIDFVEDLELARRTVYPRCAIGLSGS